jgi:hypothetical protein
MITAWLAALAGIVLLVELLLPTGGDTPRSAWRWTVAAGTGVLAFGMTYGMPAWLCWWALRKARQTARASSWVWTATLVLVLTSSLFRIIMFRTDDGQFGIDGSWPLHCAIGYFFGGALPPGLTWWRLLWMGGLPLGYLVQVAILIGATAPVLRRSRRALGVLIGAGAGSGESE